MRRARVSGRHVQGASSQAPGGFSRKTGLQGPPGAAWVTQSSTPAVILILLGERLVPLAERRPCGQSSVATWEHPEQQAQ